MKPKTPTALKNGHENLYKDIEVIVSSGGKTAEQANTLAKVLHPHFKKEEEYALPPLSLLIALSEGNWKIDSKTAIVMADRLHSELTEMKKEHDNINRILEKLKMLAIEEKNLKAMRFVDDLNLHIEIEDQVLYPATILIGNYLKTSRLNN